jgi:exosortase H (IPTLxxWG-CTERM-specific)
MRIALRPQGLNLRFAVIMTIYGGAVFLVYRDEVLGPILAPLAAWTAHITLVLVHGLGIDGVRDGAVLAHPDGFAYKVAYTCTGFFPITTFIACVLAYPGKWHAKRVGIAFGVPLLWVVNLLRLVHLFYLGVYIPDAFAPAHEVVWKGLVAVTFIALWLSWIRWSEKRVSPAAAPS